MILTRLFALLTVLFLAAVFSGCDSSLGSCTVGDNTGKYCFSITSDDATSEEMEDACDALSGNYSEDDCSISDAVGTCTYTSGNNKFEQQYGSGYDADAAEAACDLLSGTWKAE